MKQVGVVELEQIYERDSKQSAVTGHRMAGVAGAKKMQVAVGELGKAGRCRGLGGADRRGGARDSGRGRAREGGREGACPG